MLYSDLLDETQTLLGDIPDVTPMVYNAQDYHDALQYAQERIAVLLGLTYKEATIPTGTFLDATGDSLTSVTIPTDAIIVTRLELL